MRDSLSLRHAISRNYNKYMLDILLNSQQLLLDCEKEFRGAIFSKQTDVINLLLKSGHVPFTILDDTLNQLINTSDSISTLEYFDDIVTLMESYGIKFFQITYLNSDVSHPALASLGLSTWLNVNCRSATAIEHTISFLERHTAIGDKNKFLYCLIRCNAPASSVLNHINKYDLSVDFELFQYTLKYCQHRYKIVETFILMGYKITKEDIKLVFSTMSDNSALCDLILNTYTDQMIEGEKNNYMTSK